MPKRTTRPYRKRKRAEAEEETRRRITEAAVELHGTVGPANTTVTDVAKRAGVSRMTVYNHFPTEVDLFSACSSHWAAQNPFPDPSSWSVRDPAERLRVALGELYAWYGQNRKMLGNVLRDTPNLPALGEVMDGLWTRWTETVIQALARGWFTRDTEALDGALHVAVDFNTWRILSESGLQAPDSAELMANLVSCLGRG